VPPPLTVTQIQALRGEESAQRSTRPQSALQLPAPACPAGEIAYPTQGGSGVHPALPVAEEPTEAPPEGSEGEAHPTLEPDEFPTTPVAPPGTGEGPYYYAGTGWLHEAYGAAVWSTIGEPKLGAKLSDHSIAQIAVANNGFAEKTVEVGWNVDKGLYGDVRPHFFTYVNKDSYVSNGQPGGDCYNCNFVPLVGAKAVPGQALSTTATPTEFATYYEEHKWWIIFNNETIGYVPDSFWGGSFTTSYYQSFYGEVYDPASPPETQMGNGLRGNEPAALHMESPLVMTREPGSGGVINYSISNRSGPNQVYTPGWYDIANIEQEGKQWWFGGHYESGVPARPEYYVKNRNSSKCADIANWSQANGAKLQQWDCFSAPMTSANQVFYLLPIWGSYYNLVARNSGKCLDVTGGSLSAGAPIQQWSCGGASNWNQLWRPEELGGAKVFRNARSNYCLDVTGGSLSNGAQVQQWPCLGAGQLNQLWWLNTV